MTTEPLKISKHNIALPVNKPLEFFVDGDSHYNFKRCFRQACEQVRMAKLYVISDTELTRRLNDALAALEVIELENE